MPLLPETRYSLLVRLAEPADAAAWSEFTALYETAVFRYSRGRGLQHADALDVTQQVLLAVHQAVGQWKPMRGRGSFRAWLVETAHRQCLQALRTRSRSDRAAGGTTVTRQLHEFADGRSAGTEEERDWQRWAFCWAAGQVQQDSESPTWRAFWLTAVEGLPSAEVGARLGMNIGAVYAAKCRVLARIRERAQALTRERS